MRGNCCRQKVVTLTLKRFALRQQQLFLAITGQQQYTSMNITCLEANPSSHGYFISQILFYPPPSLLHVNHFFPLLELYAHTQSTFPRQYPHFIMALSINLASFRLAVLLMALLQFVSVALTASLPVATDLAIPPTDLSMAIPAHNITSLDARTFNPVHS